MVRQKPQERTSRTLVACFLAFAATVCLIKYGSGLSNVRSRVGSNHKLGAARKLATYFLDTEGQYQARTFRFEVCNGFANQRIALAFGIVMAHLLGRVAVLPRVLLNGTQTTADWTVSSPESTEPLSRLYDSQFLIAELDRNDIVAIESAEAPDVDAYKFLAMKDAPADPVEWLREEGSNATHLRVDCAFLRLPPWRVQANSKHIWAILNALRPSRQLRALVDAGVSRLKALNGGGLFNFLHARMELDWIGHCRTWSSIADGIIRNNCFNNTFSLDTFLHSRGVSQDIVLYVASSWEEANTEIVGRVMSRLVLGGYQIVTQRYLFPNHGLSREEAACVEYYIALESSKFIGNSVSSFSAILILERQRVGAWSTYYNGGNIPMSAVVPLYKLPWVFTYNSWSADYEYMLKAAVRSGLQSDTFVPFCLFGGNRSSPIALWLQDQGVTMIYSEPKWADRLIEGMKKGNNKAHSHLYATPQMSIGTWQRIDIPTLAELSEWEYVLFTDADVYFRKPVTLDSFAQPLPDTIGMAAEGADMFPYNAGVMLMHMPPLRATYDSFLDFIFSNEHGMYFPGYGPVDQGAFNQFYENSVIDAKLSQQFNAKPYLPPEESALIVHFHGPKPADFLAFLESGKCRDNFGELCSNSAKQSFCFYGLEWAKHIPEEDVGRRVLAACSILTKFRSLQEADANDTAVRKHDASDLPVVLSDMN